MPRQNAPRQVEHEARLAERIRAERERHGWTYEGLARRMTDAGCAIQGSAIYKIENSDPPRRITLDEAVTFAQVFGTTLPAMLLPVDVALSKEALKLYERYDRLSDEFDKISDEMARIQERLGELVFGDSGDAVSEALSAKHSEQALKAVELWRIMRDDRARIYGKGD